MTTAEFVSQLTEERINALCDAKVGGSWVINPGGSNRQKEKDHWISLFRNAKSDAAWDSFRIAVVSSAQIAGALNIRPIDGSLGDLHVSLSGRATPV